MCLKFMSVLPIKVFLRMNFKANITVHRCWEGITQKLSKFPPAACFGTNFEEPTFEFGWFHLSGNSCEGFLQFDCLHLMLSRWLPLFGNAIHIKYIQIIYSIYQSLPFAMVRCWFIVLQPLLSPPWNAEPDRRLRGLTAPSRNTTSRGCCPAQRRKCPQPRCMLGYSS
jgi:hypothetical protein